MRTVPVAHGPACVRMETPYLRARAEKKATMFRHYYPEVGKRSCYPC